ncbi:MAG: hypothetical protein M1517_05075 [Deltaproteobacteria bacterium]|nr:hypothetical protein [Deltaproteobacteria bacterium]
MSQNSGAYSATVFVWRQNEDVPIASHDGRDRVAEEAGGERCILTGERR